MKIVQLLSGYNTAITNEEQEFLNHHKSTIRVDSLNERDQWIAQKMVRKGLYSISKDNNTLIRNVTETNTR